MTACTQSPFCGCPNCYSPLIRYSLNNYIQRQMVSVFPEETKPQFPSKPLARYQGAIRLFRYWNTKNGFLNPMVYRENGPWVKGINEAQDYATKGGFYGWNDLNQAPLQEEGMWTAFQRGQLRLISDANFKVISEQVVFGTFLGYGRIKVHEKGARTQYAIPEYIFEPQSFNYATELLTVGENYGMKMITPSQAAELKTGIVPFVRRDSE